MKIKQIETGVESDQVSLIHRGCRVSKAKHRVLEKDIGRERLREGDYNDNLY